MNQIELKFDGICTHLTATSQHNWPTFKLWADDHVPIQHRVVLANSDLIASHLQPEHRFPKHNPKLSIAPKEVNAELAELFGPDGTWMARDVEICFEGVDVTAGDASHEKSLAALPHIWVLANETGNLRKFVRRGWSRFAWVYIDFIGGVRFRTVPGKNVQVFGTLFFDHDPVMVVRDRNRGKGERYSLAGVTKLTIGNEPEPLPGMPAQSCTEYDYLLNYFPTDLDLLTDPPMWGTPLPSEVYCSSTNYP